MRHPCVVEIAETFTGTAADAPGGEAPTLPDLTRTVRHALLTCPPASRRTGAAPWSAPAVSARC